jgi:hypothetical protein
VAHSHSHSHGHHHHAHEHSHAPHAHPAQPASASILRMAGLYRVGLAIAASGVMWAVIWLAMR